MTTAQKPLLRLQLDEVDMIAYASDTEPVFSFYCDDSDDSNTTVERARDVVQRVNVHDQLLDSLLDIKRFAEKSGDHDTDPFALLDLIAHVTQAAIAIATQQGRAAP